MNVVKFFRLGPSFVKLNWSVAERVPNRMMRVSFFDVVEQRAGRQSELDRRLEREAFDLDPK